MNTPEALILGVIQGLTEFLPISSSAHLVIAQSFFPQFSQPGIFFDTILHTGTLFAVIFYFRDRLLRISFKMGILLLIATIPAALAGFFFEEVFAKMFSDVRSVGWQLLVTALICFLIDKGRTNRKSIGFLDSLFIGVAQAISIIPGISRSGATIFAASSRGIDRLAAAEFSLLLSIPAILGATILQSAKYAGSENVDYLVFLAGFVASLITGFISIKILLKFLVSKHFSFFAIYAAVLGILVLLFTK